MGIYGQENHYDEHHVLSFLKSALEEDVRDGDVTSLACVPASKRVFGALKVKQGGVLAGMEVAKAALRYADVDCQLGTMKSDGDEIKIGDVAFEVAINARALLKVERVILNTMQRMSGIATLSRKYAEAVADLPVKILDTRKTTPLFRYFEKWAVQIGGCHNYRMGLYDWYMIKDNHTDACGSITKAIELVNAHQEKNNTHYGITVEVRDLKELGEVLRVGKVSRIMLDNFSIPLMEEAVEIVNKRFEVEASGGVSLANLRAIALTKVDYISSGALTHSSSSLDLSLKVMKE